MPAKTNTTKPEYETVVVGAAYLVKNILRKLGFVGAVNEVLRHQPELGTTYGDLAQVIVANRLAFQPAPLYEMAAWAAEQGLDQVFGLEAAWLDDDRLGAMLEALATHQVSIWSSLIKNAVNRFEKAQVRIEQTIDFIKSPVQIRPMWLHSPKRLAGLTLLIMVAVLVAALLEHQVRCWIAKTGRLVRGLRPEGRDDPYPTAKALLKAFQHYALVLVRHGKRR